MNDIAVAAGSYPVMVLARAASEGDLSAARAQMGFSLAWHIVVACLGVGLPALTLLAEWLGVRRNDPALQLLARRWARAMGVLFAVGAVSEGPCVFRTV
ncbi:cytochrome ubiquinol oxidase subunit I [Streptomyces sp. NPDC005393]|uniref:cytochrome ubiquinol oxidase subunit I n=1 Tax=Streptomyces sp. NPDC005393 TaxID=3157041 RepID=UPI0033A1DC30